MLRRAAADWHVYLPLLLLCVLVAPHVVFLLPASTDLSDTDIYQPLRTLKFFKSAGQEYHKYGPIPNFILAAPYAVCLACWKATGDFSSPASDFPYGLRRPLEQLGTLILISRALFVLIGCVMFGLLAVAMHRFVRNKLAVLFAMLLLVVGNPILVWKLPVPEIDSPMYTFTAGAMAMFTLMLADGPSTRRWIWMTLFSVAAVSSKELAAPIIAAMFAVLAVVTWRGARSDPAARRRWLRAAVGITSAAVVLYLLANVIYSPRNWWTRVHYWLAGEGLDSAVWGGRTGWNLVCGIASAVADNLGPGGVVAMIVLLVAALVRRDRVSWLLLIPAIAMLPVLLFVRYTPDRFYTVATLALAPFAARGIAELLGQARLRAAAIGLFGLLAVANLWFATVTWEWLARNEFLAAERHALANVPKDKTVAVLSTYSNAKGSSRFEWLGYPTEVRAVQEWMNASRRPDVVYVSERRYRYMLDARRLRGRAEMLARDAGFDISQFPGLEAMGYRARRIGRPATWLRPFWFMPAIRHLPERDLLVLTR